MSRKDIESTMKAHAIAVKSEFVPWSRSRDFKPAKTTSKTLNWRVTVTKDGRDILTTDYSAGIAHAPSYKQPFQLTTANAERLEFEVEHGRVAKGEHSLYGGKAINPDACDVINSLCLDSGVLDHPTFESWASDYGYDTDSRKAEVVYQTCLDIALKLRNGLGDDTLQALTEACQDF